MIILLYAVIMLQMNFCLGNDFAKKKELMQHFFDKKEKSDRECVTDKVLVETVCLEHSPKGMPSANALKNLIRNDFFPLKSIDDIWIEDIISTRLGYMVSSIGLRDGKKKYPVFFLKVNSNRESSSLLSKIRESHIGRLGLQKHYNDKNPIPRRYLPQIAWLEKIYIYQNEQGRDCFVELSHAAVGKTVKEIMKTESLERIKRCSYCVGRSLALFQQVFIKYVDKDNPKTWLTVKHGDFHDGNVVFDMNKERVFFIDNETMSDGYSIFKDVIYFSEMIGGIRFLNDSCFRTINSIYSFFDGYVSGYPKNQQSVIASSLAKYLLDSLGSINQRFTVNSCLIGNQGKNTDAYRSFIMQHVEFIKSHILKFGYDSVVHGVSEVNVAVYQRKLEQVKQFLQSENHVNTIDDFGTTPLFWALEKNDTAVLDLLQDHNVDFELATNLFPRGVLEYFICLDKPDVVKNFIDHLHPTQSFLEEQLFKAALHGAVNTINLLLSLGQDVNIRYQEEGSYQFATLLHIAVRKMHDSVIQELLKVPGVNVDVLDVSGRTPLLLLAETVVEFSLRDIQKVHSIAKMLLEAGADVTLKNRSGKGVFDYVPDWAEY